jgi:hypothetical protein
MLAQYPERSLPQALPQWSDLKAAYRFFDNAKAVPEHILSGHIQATYSRLRAVPLVLAVQAQGLTLYCIIAWRILYATMLARATPELPCTVFLTTEEWQALYCHANRLAQPPQAPPSLSQAVLWIAKMGRIPGAQKRRASRPTNPVAGVQYLHHITQMFLIMRQNGSYG